MLHPIQRTTFTEKLSHVTMFSLYLSFITQLLNIELSYLCHKSNKYLHASFILTIYFADSVYAAFPNFRNCQSRQFAIIMTINLFMVYP